MRAVDGEKAGQDWGSVRGDGRREENKEEEDMRGIMELQEEETRAVEFHEEVAADFPRSGGVTAGEKLRTPAGMEMEPPVRREAKRLVPSAAAFKTSFLSSGVQGGEGKDKPAQSPDGAGKTRPSSPQSSDQWFSSATSPDQTEEHLENDGGAALPSPRFPSPTLRQESASFLSRSGPPSAPSCLRPVCCLGSSPEASSAAEAGTERALKAHDADEKRSEKGVQEDGHGRTELKKPDSGPDQEPDKNRQKLWRRGGGSADLPLGPERTMISELSNDDGHEERDAWKSTVRIVQRKKEECYCVTEVDYIPRFWTTDVVCYFTNKPNFVLLIKRINSRAVTTEAAGLAQCVRRFVRRMHDRESLRRLHGPLLSYMHHVLGLTVIVEPSAAEEMAAAVSNSVPLKTWAEDDFHFSNPESRISSSSSASSLERRRQHSPHQDMKRRGRRGSSSSSSVSSSSSLSSPSPPSFCSTSSSLHRRSAGLRRRDRRHLSSSGRRSPSSAKSSYQRLPPQLCESIDVVVALGGDGTMLWVSRLFEESVPPVLGVSMGSLGYLTRFPLDEAREQLTEMAARKKFSVNLRCRLKDHEVRQTLVAFNECVIDRGHSSNLCSLDVYCNDCFFTTVAADGLILATPTGSTAYSMSAGGSMVHPKVPCILFTPICPHSLSFRPLILPDSVVLRIVVPEDSRGSVWIAVDGRSRTQVKRGMCVLVSLSAFPFPMVVRRSASCQDTWLESLKKGLNWNLRVRQGGRGDREDPCPEHGTEDWGVPDEATAMGTKEEERGGGHRYGAGEESFSGRPSRVSTSALRSVSDLGPASSLPESTSDSVSRLESPARTLTKDCGVTWCGETQASCPAGLGSFPCTRRPAGSRARCQGDVGGTQSEGSASNCGCTSVPCIAGRRHGRRFGTTGVASMSADSSADGYDSSPSSPVSSSWPVFREEGDARLVVGGRLTEKEGEACKGEDGSSVLPSPSFHSPGRGSKPASSADVGKDCAASLGPLASSPRCSFASAEGPRETQMAAKYSEQRRRSFLRRHSNSAEFSSSPSPPSGPDGRRQEVQQPSVNRDRVQEEGRCVPSDPLYSCSSRSAFTSPLVPVASVANASSLGPRSATSVGHHHPPCTANPTYSRTPEDIPPLSPFPSSRLPSTKAPPPPRIHKELSPEFVKGPVFMVSSLQSCTGSLPTTGGPPPVRCLSSSGRGGGGREGIGEDSFGPDRAELFPRGDSNSCGRSEEEREGASSEFSHRFSQDKEAPFVSIEEADNAFTKEYPLLSSFSSSSTGYASTRTDNERPLGQGPPICPCCSRASKFGLSLAEWGKHQVGHHRVHRVVSYGEEGHLEGQHGTGDEVSQQKRGVFSRGRERPHQEAGDRWGDVDFPVGVVGRSCAGSDPAPSARTSDKATPPIFLSRGADEELTATGSEGRREQPCASLWRDEYWLRDEGNGGEGPGTALPGRHSRSDQKEPDKILDERASKASTESASVAGSVSQHQLRGGERSFFSAVSGSVTGESESKESDISGLCGSSASLLKEDEGRGAEVGRGSRTADSRESDEEACTGGPGHGGRDQDGCDWKEQTRSDEARPDTTVSHAPPTAGISEALSAPSESFFREVQLSPSREGAEGTGEAKGEEQTSHAAAEVLSEPLTKGRQAGGSFSSPQSSGTRTTPVLLPPALPPASIDTCGCHRSAPNCGTHRSDTGGTLAQSSPVPEGATMPQARREAGGLPFSRAQSRTRSEETSQPAIPVGQWGQGDDLKFCKRSACSECFLPSSQNAAAGGVPLASAPCRAASAPPARLENNAGHFCSTATPTPLVQASVDKSPFTSVGAVEGVEAMPAARRWGRCRSPPLQEFSSCEARHFSGPPCGDRGMVPASRRCSQRAPCADPSCPCKRSSPRIRSAGTSKLQPAGSTGQERGTGKAHSMEMSASAAPSPGSFRCRETAEAKLEEARDNRSAPQTLQTNARPATGLPFASGGGIRKRSGGDEPAPAEVLRESRDSEGAPKGTPRRRLPRCSFSTGALASVSSGPRRPRSSAAADELGADEGPGESAGPSPIRPSSSTGEMQRVGGGGGSVRTSGGNQSVFILPTDECTTMVRLVSRSSRSSSDLFRNVQDVAVPALSPGPASVTPGNGGTGGSLAASPGANPQQCASAGAERQRKSRRSSPLQSPYSWPSAGPPPLVSVQGESTALQVDSQLNESALRR